MKKYGSKWVAVALIAAMLALAACGKSDETGQTDDKVSVVTTLYPIYYFAKEIGGDRANVVNLIAAGVEPHDWTPKSKDLEAASKAQLFLYNGAGLEGWVDTFLNGLGSEGPALTVETSKGIELIQGGHSHGHDHDHGHAHEGEAADDHDHAHEGESTDDHDHTHEGEAADDHDHAHEGEAADDHGHAHEGEAADDHGHAHEGEAADDHDHAHEEDAAGDHGHDHSGLGVDPHTWTSPRSALVMAQNIRDAYVEVDPDNKAVYDANYADLEARLKELDAKFEQGLSGLERRDIVVSHQAFGYLCRDYGLNQIAIMGLSPDAEPRAQDILEIANFVKENGVKYIFFEELVSEQLASMLAAEARVDTLVLNPVEGLTPEQEKAGENYFTLMERNLQNLQKALE
ncbi:metal ABC transporter solute-binding protein, Zn/Mn family [Paenibacillaceae bacterium WGS1546]|uniref:metal ABC transporter solute-binding protein, Zn/Mn family n=1 Tax=Cohnella sp. WGS1546 TaxID=3366810 RepID=UPI00372D6772